MWLCSLRAFPFCLRVGPLVPVEGVPQATLPPQHGALAFFLCGPYCTEPNPQAPTVVQPLPRTVTRAAARSVLFMRGTGSPDVSEQLQPPVQSWLKRTHNLERAFSFVLFGSDTSGDPVPLNVTFILQVPYGPGPFFCPGRCVSSVSPRGIPVCVR